jgi:hypothetical protein
VRVYALAMDVVDYENIYEKKYENSDDKTGKMVIVGQKEKRYPPNLDALKRITEATMGKAYHVRDLAEMRSAYQEIERELRSQYKIRFASEGKSGSMHVFNVKTRNNAVVKHPYAFIY